MAALRIGTMAPDFSLRTMDGGSFSIRKAMERGPVVLAFFKIDCPVCQFALPYVDRLYEAYKGKNVTIIGVSQNEKKDTRLFVKEYGLKLPIALDDTERYPVSNAYGLTNVPTVFYISQDGSIEQSIVSWSRSDMQELAQNLAKATDSDPATIFHPGESVPEFKAG